MAQDDEVHEFAKRFPEGLLSLLGVQARGRYTVQSVQVKTVKRTADLVFWPTHPLDPRTYVEWQGYGDALVERRLGQELYNHCMQECSFSTTYGRGAGMTRPRPKPPSTSTCGFWRGASVRSM